MSYYHGVATYVRDHFYVDDLRMSGISGGCSTLLALAMGLDLYQILLLGLHTKRWILQQGLYLNSFETLVEYVNSLFEQIGLTDKDVEAASARNQCFIGVTQCFPPRHRCEPIPKTVRDLVDLWLCSCNVVPFFSTPGTYQGRYYIDGGFSAVWSLPDRQPWSETIRVTCLPPWTTKYSPAMATADIQPSRFMPLSIVVMYPFSHHHNLIRMGYEDAKARHSDLLARGLRPLPNAPLTPWAQWDALLAAIDEDHLPELSTKRSTDKAAPMEKAHDEVLRTYSQSDLQGLLSGRGQRLMLKASALPSSASDAGLLNLGSPKAILKAAS